MDREFRELQARHEAERRQAQRERLAYDLRRVQEECARLERLVSETDRRLAAIANEPLWGVIPGALLFLVQQVGDYRVERQELARLHQRVTEMRNQEASLQRQINAL